MRKSIMQNTPQCLYCRTTLNLHYHHVYGGRNRQKSEKYKCTCWLCGVHHDLSNDGVHFNKELDTEIKDKCQRIFETMYSHELFMQEFGRDYIEEKYNEGGYKWIS